MTNNLPIWDLSDLYKSKNDEEINYDIERLSQMVSQFHVSYFNKINSLHPEELFNAIKSYEAIINLQGKLSSYAYLQFAENMSDENNGKFYQNISEKLNDIFKKMLFFSLEINKIEENKLSTFYERSFKLLSYKSFLDQIRLFKNHQLSEELENFLFEKDITARESWITLFNETIASLKFQYEGKELTESEIFDLMSSKDENIRQKAAKSIGDIFSKNIKIFTRITNVLAKDKQINDKWRKFSAPINSRNLSNNIENEVVELLINTVKKNYTNISHRYYALKAQIFGKKQLDYWDRNAPYQEANDVKIEWDEAKRIVCEAYNEFNPQIGEIASKFFENNWIHAAPIEGKDPGAFAHPTITTLHPYLLVNYKGKMRDVMTLAHEVGHGIHQILAASQGELLSDTPLTLAETASVFGEQLTFRKLLRETKDNTTKKYLLASKIEDMINTVIRQIAFCSFELDIHTRRAEGELSSAEISELWFKNQKESLGEAINCDHPEYGSYWCYIPHFIHTPFYVYAYAFGDCLVNSLYKFYLKNPREFDKKYIEMLRSGGSKHHSELLSGFNLDIYKESFWQNGMNMIIELIDEFERL